MKKSYILLSATALMATACKKEQTSSVSSVIENQNLEQIIAKKQDLKKQEQQLKTDIALLEKEITKLNPNEKIALVTTLKTKKQTFEHFLELQGHVQTKQNIVLKPEMGGVLSQVYVKAGQRVSKGQVLARVDDGGISQQLTQVKIQADLAQTTFERQERLWKQKIGSEIQYLQAKSAAKAQQEMVAQLQSQLKKTTITAPFSGVIDDVITQQGNVVAPGQTPVIRIINLQNMYIASVVPEHYLPYITKNKKVVIHIPVLDTAITSKIAQVGSYIDPNNRTFKIEIPVPNTKGQVKPNLSTKLQINDYSNAAAILIPQRIISENAAGQQYVYTISKTEKDKGIAQRTIITTGKTKADLVEITSGLQDGMLVIVEGARSVKDAQKVMIKNIQN